MRTISDLHLWGWDWGWDGWTHVTALLEGAAGTGGESYFVYIEETHELTYAGENGLDGPLGEALNRPDRVHVRIRASGVRVGRFLDLMERVTALGVEISPAERETRALELRENLSGVPIPLIDLLLTREQAGQPWARLAAPGAWHVLGVSYGSQDPESVFVLIGNPEDVQEPESRRARAEFLLPPLPEHELRLRDIFSLKHIPDAELDDENWGGTPEPVPGGPIAHSVGVGIVESSVSSRTDSFGVKLPPEESP